MTRRAGRPVGTHSPPVLTVLVSFRVAPVLASRILAEAGPGESIHTAARRLLGERLGVGGDGVATTKEST